MAVAPFPRPSRSETLPPVAGTGDASAMQALHLDAGETTFVAVAGGAFLATIGGLLANQFERLLMRRERQRSAALLFGEILSALRTVVWVANTTRQRGDPYGRITMRLIKGAMREAETYGRNRESLFDLRDPVMRARTHLLIARMTLALEATLDAHEAIGELDLAIKRQADNPALSAELAQRMEVLVQDRAGSFDQAVSMIEEIDDLLKSVSEVALYAFDAHTAVIRADLGVE